MRSRRRSKNTSAEGKTTPAAHVSDYRWLLYRHFLFAGRLGDIPPPQITDRLSKLPPAQHNHALTAGRIFFNWSRKRRYLTSNPCDGLSSYARQPRTRVLSDDELASIWQACEQHRTARSNGEASTETPLTRNGDTEAEPSPAPLSPHFAALVQLLILTGLRRGECAHIQSEHLKGNLLTLPPTLTKNGREHILPLTDLAMRLLQKPSGSYVFPGRQNSAFNGWSKSKNALDRLSGVTGWTLHDVRRTVATGMAEMGVAPHVIERILNHASGQISGVALVYNRARYIEEMRAALELWESRLAAALQMNLAHHDASRCNDSPLALPACVNLQFSRVGIRQPTTACDVRMSPHSGDFRCQTR